MPLPKISNRATNTITSPIRKYVPLIRAAEESGVEVLKLHIGDPDLAAPPQILRTIKAYKEKTLPYAPSSGLPQHIAAWIHYYKNLGITLAPSNIVPTAGCAEAIQIALLTVADPDDEVLVFEPLYTGFKAAAGMFGITFVPITLNITNGFAIPSKEEILKKISPKTKAIIVINPDNPTGKIWKKEELETIVDIAVAHNIFLIADETYREIVFTGKPTTALRFSRGKENIIVVDSLSKRFSVPGARIGCVVSLNKDAIATVLKLAMARLSTPTLEQIGVIPLLKNPTAYTKKITAEYKKRKDIVIKALKKIPDVLCHTPGGAFYVVARLPIDDADHFAKFLINDFRHKKKTVTITPIKDFYISPDKGKNEIRIALVRPQKILKEAMMLLSQALKEYKNRENKI